jgi:ABC-type Zn uptake system ZnuABC Zn-binding protein ZnuA
MNAMVSFEEATGKSILKGFDKENMGVKELRALIWCCLLHDDEGLTQKNVGSWIDIDNMAEVQEKFMEAFTAAMPDGSAQAEEGEEKKETGPLAEKASAG